MTNNMVQTYYKFNGKVNRTQAAFNDKREIKH